jgi:fermentation-respiration switch protein FrsA (DUF1100 family)
MTRAPDRQNVSFVSNGLACKGWFYLPHNANKPAPALVVSHGFSAVKEQYLDSYASRFAAAGFAVLVFDYRFLGESEGEPRGRIIPHEQHDDLRAALDWLTARPEVDAARVGIWGTSYSGSHSLFLSAFDPRIKVVAVQVPGISGARSILMLAGKEGFDGLQQLFVQDHAARNAGGQGGMVPVVAEEGLALFPGPDALEWFTGTAKTIAPNWINQVTVETAAKLIEYYPAAFIDLIAPKPLLIIAAKNDTIIPLDHITEAFARAGEPKQLEVLDCTHFDVYSVDPWHSRAAELATNWFKRHL